MREDLWTQLDPDLKSACSLWRGVILQAATDAAFGNLEQRREVRAWVSPEESAEFLSVCELALTDPILIRAYLRHILSKPGRESVGTTLHVLRGCLRRGIALPRLETIIAS